MKFSSQDLPDVQEVVRQGEPQEISTKNVLSLITEYRTEVREAVKKNCRFKDMVPIGLNPPPLKPV